MRTTAALAPIVVLGVLWWALCWFDLIRRRHVRYLPKWLWAVICVIATPIGGIAYFLLGRGEA